MKSVRKSFLIAFIIILIFVNLIHYWQVQNNLVANQEGKIEMLVNGVHAKLQSTHRNERFFNDFLARDLRNSAKAVQHHLPPSIDDVTNEQLVQLAEDFALQGITLFVKEGDDVISVKSSEPHEIGMSTKNWVQGKWYKMFNGLLTNQDVEPIEGFGEALPNFWAAPINTSKSNPDLITKWGYYNDGTTDYLINTYVEESVVEGFFQNVGLQKAIDDILESYPYILTVTILNVDALKHGEKRVRETGAVRFADRMILAGDYAFPTSEDEENALKAIQQNDPIHYKAEVDDKKILKSYNPSVFNAGDDFQDKVLITITSDFTYITDELHARLRKAIFISVLSLLFGLLAIGFVSRSIERKQEALNNIQGMYENHIDSLFETIREYRHDFNHHLHTISGLSKMGLTAELYEYVNNLVKVHEEFNNFVDASIPALSGLIHSKKVEAKEKSIEFENHFENMEKLDVPVEKLTDIVKVIGNILDNAIHAVEESGKDKKMVNIYGRYKKGNLKFSISNNGLKIPDDVMGDIFKMGFTTRSKIGGTGVGLASCKKAIERYKGDINVVSDCDKTIFSIIVPMAEHESRKKLSPHKRSRIELENN